MINNNYSSKINFSVPCSTKPTIHYEKLDSGVRPLTILRKRSQQLDDSAVWSIQYIIDELTISLLKTKIVFCMLNSHRKTNLMSDPQRAEWAQEQNRYNSGNGLLRRLYEEQARYKMYRIPVFRPSPVFVVYLKHLDDRVKRELAKLDKETKDFVMKEAIGRIFEQVDSGFFLLSVKSLFQWRLE